MTTAEEKKKKLKRAELKIGKLIVEGIKVNDKKPLSSSEAKELTDESYRILSKAGSIRKARESTTKTKDKERGKELKKFQKEYKENHPNSKLSPVELQRKAFAYSVKKYAKEYPKK